MPDEVTVREAAERLLINDINDTCPHLYNAHRDCQWCHRDQSTIDADKVARAYLTLTQPQAGGEWTADGFIISHNGVAMSNTHIVKLLNQRTRLQKAAGKALDNMRGYNQDGGWDDIIQELQAALEAT